MKQIFIILLVTTFLQAYSQENDSTIVLQSSGGRLSGLVNIQDLDENYNSFKFEGHWAGVEFGINGFANSGYGMYPASEQNFLDNDLIRSNILNLNVIQYSKGIQQTRTNIGLVTGVGLSFQSYHLDNNTTITLDENGKIHPSILYFDSSQKSKLSTLYLDVPLLVEFQIPISHFADRLYFSAATDRIETAGNTYKNQVSQKREARKIKVAGRLCH